MPKVTVQIAVYNEVYVVRRAIDPVCHLGYPRDRLEVQVVDGSTYETVSVINERISYWQEQGIDIQMFHRTNRQEFKAGALREALAKSFTQNNRKSLGKIL